MPAGSLQSIMSTSGSAVSRASTRGTAYSGTPSRGILERSAGSKIPRAIAKTKEVIKAAKQQISKVIPGYMRATKASDARAATRKSGVEAPRKTHGKQAVAKTAKNALKAPLRKIVNACKPKAHREPVVVVPGEQPLDCYLLCIHMLM